MALSYPKKSNYNNRSGNVRFVPQRVEKNYSAYSTAFVQGKGWTATPYSYKNETAEYIPDLGGVVIAKSRPAVVELLFTKNFNFHDGEINHNRMQCIDWM